MFDKAQALKMLDAFESVGATAYDITHTNIDGEKRGFRSKQSPEQTLRSIPFLVDAAERRQNNVILRPHSGKAYLVQLDDLNAEALERVRPVAFLILVTSPGNHQAWLAIPGGTADFARRVKKGSGADATASGATRVAGTANFKRKYEPNFPMVTILEAVPGRTVTPDQLENLGLVSPEPEYLPPPARVSPSRGVKRWPNYRRCLERAPNNRDGNGKDTSRADFVWCMTAIDWGWSIEETAARLMEESRKAQENGEPYALLTARNAAAAVARRTKPASGFRPI
jgi:hypothetical protein